MTTSLGLLGGALILKPALVLGAAALLTIFFRRHTAATRHAVWTVAVISVIALPILGAVVPPVRVPVLPDALERSLHRAIGSPDTAPVPTAAPGPRSAPGAAPDAGASDRVRLGVEGPQDWLPKGLFALWLLGAVLIGARRVVAEVRVRRIVRHARPTSNPHLARLLTSLARSSGIHRPVHLRIGDEATSPAVVGVFRPAVLLPSAVDRWSETDIKAVLVHELGHVARTDCLINLLGDVASVVYWCNPAVWFAVRRLRAESESACDDRVLRYGTEPEAYAHLLLAVARAARAAGARPDAATAMARPGELESRLLAVFDARVRRDPLPRWMAAALAGVGIAFTLPTAAFSLRAETPAAVPPAAMASAAQEQLTAPEPDRLADSVARPESERVALAPDTVRLSRGARQALAGPDSLLAQLLVAALDHKPEHDGDLVRERAAWALAQTRDGQLVEPLLEALEAREWRVQAYAAWAIAPAADPRAVDRLIPLLRHPVWRLRAMAAYALRVSHDPRAEAAMADALDDSAWQVRLEAVEYFAALGGPALSDRLRPRLDDRHIAVRLAAGQALTLR